MTADDARRARAALVTECLTALAEHGFTRVTKHVAVRTSGFPCAVELVSYKYVTPESGAEDDWAIIFAPPGSQVVGGMFQQTPAQVSQAAQRGLVFYTLRDPDQARAFRDDFMGFTIPFLLDVDSPRTLLRRVLERSVELSESENYQDEFARARTALDLMTSCPLDPDGIALAEEVIADAVRCDPGIRRDVERYRGVQGVGAPS